MDKSLELMVRMGVLRPETVYGLRKINELNLGRIQKHGENGMVIVSANRSSIKSDNPQCDLLGDYIAYLKAENLTDTPKREKEWLAARNKAADKDLKEKLIAGGYSFSPVFGGYHGEDGVVDDFEPSYIIYNYDKNGNPGNFEDLLDLAKKLCGEYKQESVFVKGPGDEPPKYINSAGEQINKSASNDMKFNRKTEYYTTTARDRSNPQKFSANVLFESMYYRVYERTEKMEHSQYGEYIL